MGAAARRQRLGQPVPEDEDEAPDAPPPWQAVSTEDGEVAESADAIGCETSKGDDPGSSRMEP